jgi:hypothetical protein
MADAGDTSWAVAQDLLAAYEIARLNGDAAAMTSIKNQASAQGYTIA